MIEDNKVAKVIDLNIQRSNLAGRLDYLPEFNRVTKASMRLEGQLVESDIGIEALRHLLDHENCYVKMAAASALLDTRYREAAISSLRNLAGLVASSDQIERRAGAESEDIIFYRVDNLK